MADKSQVIAAHKAHPKWGAEQIADDLNCCSAYVRATARRQRLTLPPSPRRPRNPENITALGRAAREAGLTLADIQGIAATIGTA